jgi:cytochrome P450
MNQLPPGPKPLPLLGNVLDMQKNPLQFLLNNSKKHGDVVHFSLPGLPIYMFNHPEHIEEILRHQNQNFIKDKITRDGSLLVGNGLLTSEGQFWKKQRRLAQPAFHHERINAYAEVMVRYTEEATNTWKAVETRDLHHDMTALTLRIVSRTLFGLETSADAKRIGQALDTATQRFEGIGAFIPPDWPTPGNYRLKKAIQALDDIVYGIIRERRKNGDTGDLLSMLIAATEDGSGMDDKQLRDEAITLLLAGHETTALSLSYVWRLLAQHPEAQEKLFQEVSTVLAGKAATAADMPRLPYTEWVVREAMRLYPPAWAIGREVVTPCTVGGYPLKRGLQVWIAQWVVHRDERYFPEPEKFSPERWDNNLAKTLPKYAYLPFGGGPRVCIGNAFSMMEMVLVVATIARKFRFSLVDDKPLSLIPSITLRPRGGVHLNIAQRALPQ